MRSDLLRLQDILEAIDIIAQYLPKDQAAFEGNPPIQSHIYRRVMIVGEAAWQLSDELKAANPAVPWKQIEGMRHIMVHDYFKVDWEIVYRTAAVHIPALKPHVQLMLESVRGENES